MKEQVEEYREALIEAAVEQDEAILRNTSKGRSNPRRNQACIRKGTRDLAFFPTYCGSSFKNKGVQLVLDAVVDYLPAPNEVNPQPEIDLEGNETAALPTWIPKSLCGHWPSRSWTIASGP
jgi:elongation factor G